MALLTHQRRERGGEHGIGNDASQLVRVNQCPSCRKAFASFAVARERLARSLVQGRCIADNTAKQYEVAELGECECSARAQICEQTDGLQRHV
eukprot:4040877-Lingulodinium_polyedra.AAC.1